MNADEFFRRNLQPAAFANQRARERLRKLRDGMVGFGTELAPLDKHLRFLPGQMTVIGGRAGTGKTAFGMQMVYSVMTQLVNREQPGVICVFSAEMEGEMLMLREACAQERISLWRVLTGDMQESEYDRLDFRLANMEHSRMFIDESPAPTLEHMMEQLAVIAESHIISMVMFDYTELAGEFDREEHRRIAKISRGLAAIAKQFECSVVTLSQLNRDIEGRADKTPNMRDLMHGGEREPDCVVILVRPSLYDKAQPKELVKAHVVKNRNGPQGEAVLGFDEQTMRFYTPRVVSTPLEQ